MMVRTFVTLVLATALSVFIIPPVVSAGGGKALFAQHCAVCHPNGGNIINPKKTLMRADLAAAGITGPAGIVKLLRNPGPGMRVFTETDLAGPDADAVARYVWDTFSR